MNLLIVESPAKAKTIEKYLGKEWRVVASVGHVRDLVPEDGSVDTENNFAMKWAIMPGKEKNIKIILDEVKKADAVYLASDPDREGEAISWHILDILNERKVLKEKPVYRVVFNEITKKAIQTALSAPREIDQNLVDAYLVRRALDYLIGFKLSPVLWRKNLGKSAGRVQSVAVALVVDREREIEAFVPVEYWSLDAMCISKKEEFKARLVKFNGDKIDKMYIGSKAQIDSILSALGQPTIDAKVISVEKKKISRRPAAPFITSTLQQEAARKLYFSAKRTSMAAQKLYEAGLITYIRTDSTNLASDAVASIREYIDDKYGSKFLPETPNTYVTKSKNAQEAHEAIRPTNVATNVDIGGDEEKLYELIWKRTVACQMTNAEFDSVVVDIQTNKTDAIFHAVGTTRTFDGFMKVYIEDKDEPEEENESKLPPLAIGDEIDIEKLLPEQHFTQPPPRYSEASLIKKLEELGIGRPSTYAPIMATIVDREYVKNEQRRFFPTPTGWLISAFLANYFQDIIDVNFTAKTEDTLDEVSNGAQKKLPALSAFWKAFNPLVAAAHKVTSPEVMEKINIALSSHLFPDGNNKCPECDNLLGLKVSKFGPFISCTKYPECKYIKNLGINNDTGQTSEKNDSGADLGDGILFKIGRFGPYVTDGNKNASAKKYSAETITIEIARELLENAGKKAEAVELGINPTTGKSILYYASGRFGSYISSNKVNVGVKEQPDLATAIDLINNKKPSVKKGWKKTSK
ncbi:MAG: type I DNA topoisomerase [Alphaproteobacteria bacterium]|nr:type I DNA topoisomerase [Alphaproteobacteria bacterium]